MSYLVIFGLVSLAALILYNNSEEIVRLYKVNTLFAPNKIIKNFCNMDKLFRTKMADRGNGAVSGIQVGEKVELGSKVEQWVKQRNVTSLAVVKKEKMIVEEYYHGTLRNDMRMSWSMAKSYLSVLVGILLEEKVFKSIDDKLIEYAPQLKGSAYESVTILNALQMMTGVAFNEDYSNFFSDIKRMGRVLALGQTLDNFAVSLKKRDCDVNEYWNYNSIDTHVLGMAVRGATGSDINSLLSEKVFKPLGLEKTPYFVTDGQGIEFISGGLNQTTRDYCRYGIMIERGGEYGGTQIVPKNWLVESVTPSAKTTKGERKFGYHWYIPYDAEDGIFFTMGIYGQFLFIDQNRHVVIVVTAADPDWREPNILHNTQEILKTIAKTV